MSWYIVSYDIRDKKRLQRLHYHLKKEALALQKSVFLVKSHRLNKVKRIIKLYSKGTIDDVRLYPITHPNAIWAAGQQADALRHLGITPQAEAPTHKKTFLQTLLPQLFKKKETQDATNR